MRFSKRSVSKKGVVFNNNNRKDHKLKSEIITRSISVRQNNSRLNTIQSIYNNDIQNNNNIDNNIDNNNINIDNNKTTNKNNTPSNNKSVKSRNVISGEDTLDINDKYLLGSPVKNWSYSSDRRRCCLVILTHCLCGDDEGIHLITTTLKWAVQVFPPGNIFIADNARSLAPPDAEWDVIRNFSEEIGCDPRPGSRNGSFHYVYLPVGNKTVSVYWVLQYWLPKVLKEGRTGCLKYSDTLTIEEAKYESVIDFAAMIDDDVKIPPRLQLPLQRFEDDPSLGCLAYSIAAGPPPGADRWQKALVSFQGVEYLIAGVFKRLQALCGGTVGPHGAISLWHLNTLLQYSMPTHNTEFLGEDLQLGMRVWLADRDKPIVLADRDINLIQGEQTKKKINNNNVPIPIQKGSRCAFKGFWVDYCVASCVTTETPSDFLTLWKQRWQSWDLAAHRQPFSGLLFVIVTLAKGRIRLWLGNIFLVIDVLATFLE
eukprot:GHVR01029915.1.p1 GENE.GHVR01029915.1~~GHVR01029915.1.p1  ORF type:complete len:548 (-),score=155.61 GHVR01029915.1:86-1537(-)